MQDGGKELISKQRGFQLINPTDKWFPGLAKIRDEFTSWEWRFGKTPKFTASRTFPIHDIPEKIENPDMKVSLQVVKGEIMDVSLRLPSCSADALASSGEILSGVQGKKYSSQTLDLLEKNLVLVDKKEELKTALRAWYEGYDVELSSDFKMDDECFDWNYFSAGHDLDEEFTAYFKKNKDFLSVKQ